MSRIMPISKLLKYFVLCGLHLAARRGERFPARRGAAAVVDAGARS